MIPIIIDVVLVIILAAFAFYGIKRGFILGISGIVILIAALYGAGVIANTYSGSFTPIIAPIVTKLVDQSVAEAKSEPQYVSQQPGTSGSKDELNTVGLDSLMKLGLFKETAQAIINELKGTLSTVGQEFKAAVSEKVTSSIAYILTFIAAFLLITIILTIALKILDLAFKLPGLGLINGAGGFALGLAEGLLILFAIAWAMRYLGGVFPEETTNQTVVLKYLMSNNLLEAFIGL